MMWPLQWSLVGELCTTMIHVFDAAIICDLNCSSVCHLANLCALMTHSHNYLLMVLVISPLNQHALLLQLKTFPHFKFGCHQSLLYC
jgi:hypothetical protein